MSDLISRQSAITLPVMPKEHREYQTYNLDDAYEQGWFDLQKCIEEFPSAEPELDEWCTDCKEYDKERHSCPRWNRVIRQTLKDAQPERKIELHGDESAIEILSELRSWFSCFDEKEGLAYHALSLAIRAIKANSTAEPERKGKWMRLNDIDGFVRCSNCGTFWDHSIIDTLHFHFCPNCGSYNGGDAT